ncbi:MAG TPA: response regulator [candidate division Zixibacteria bacterium]|nr:response regulator [candidate division Zixibacteria bacterium]
MTSSRSWAVKLKWIVNPAGERPLRSPCRLSPEESHIRDREVMGLFRALLVDDEEELVTTLQERLSYRDIDADFSLTGADAIQKMREKRFDIVVLDLKLPGISGIETMRVLKNEYPDVPIILITGHGSPDTTDDLPKGAYEYLPKPINIEKLMEVMKEALADR